MERDKLKDMITIEFFFIENCADILNSLTIDVLIIKISLYIRVGSSPGS